MKICVVDVRHISDLAIGPYFYARLCKESNSVVHERALPNLQYRAL